MSSVILSSFPNPATNRQKNDFQQPKKQAIESLPDQHMDCSGECFGAPPAPPAMIVVISTNHPKKENQEKNVLGGNEKLLSPHK